MLRRKFFAVALCLLSALWIFGCSRRSDNQPKAPEPPKEFAAMVSKKEELAALPTSEKLSKKPVIKGKIAIVQNSDGDVTVDRFSEDGSAFDADPTIPGETYNNFLPAEIYARTPEEIDTLIKIHCVTKKDEALYTNSNSNKDELKFYEYIMCEIGLIDYKTATLIGRKQVGKNVPPTVINSRTVARHPWLEIIEYLKSVSNVDKTNARS